MFSHCLKIRMAMLPQVDQLVLIFIENCKGSQKATYKNELKTGQRSNIRAGTIKPLEGNRRAW